MVRRPWRRSLPALKVAGMRGPAVAQARLEWLTKGRLGTLLGTRRSVADWSGPLGLGGELVTQLHDADFWRQRAQEARALAEILTLPLARREMEHIAAAYERLANRAERAAGCKNARERP